jgi:hypothetical protein
MKRALSTIVLMALLWLPDVAVAHSDAELEEWLRDYAAGHQAVLRSGNGAAALQYPWLLENMKERHPCREVIGTWDEEACRVPEPEPAAVASSAPSSGSRSGGSVSSGMGSGVEQWRGLVEAYFPGDQVGIALCIMAAESGGNPSAENPRSSAAGLFQFLKSTWDSMVPSDVTGGSYSSGQVFNAEANIRAAAWLSQNVGWSQWSPWNRGACH